MENDDPASAPAAPAPASPQRGYHRSLVAVTVITTGAAFVKTSFVKVDAMTPLESAQLLSSLLLAWSEFLLFFNAMGSQGKDYWLVVAQRPSLPSRPLPDDIERSNSTQPQPPTIVDETTPLLLAGPSQSIAGEKLVRVTDEEEEGDVLTGLVAPDPEPDPVAEPGGALNFYLPDPMSSSSVILDPEALSVASMTTTLYEKPHPAQPLSAPILFTSSAHSDPIILPITSSSSPPPFSIGSAPPLTSPISQSLDHPTLPAALIRSYESASALDGEAGVASPAPLPGRVAAELRMTLLDDEFFQPGGGVSEVMVGETITPTPTSDVDENLFVGHESSPVGGRNGAVGLESLAVKSGSIALDLSEVLSVEPPKRDGWHPHGGGVAEAVWAMWNADYARAEEILKDSGRHRILPRHALHLAEMFVLIESGTGREEDKTRVLEYVRVAEAVAARVIDNKEEFDAAFSAHLAYVDPSSALDKSDDLRVKARIFRYDAEVCHADALLLHGVFQIITGKEIKGAFNLRKSWKLFTKVWGDFGGGKGSRVSSEERMRSKFKDVVRCAAFGVAFFQIVMSVVPPSFSSVLKAIGFTVDRPAATATLLGIMGGACVRSPIACCLLIVDAAVSPPGGRRRSDDVSEEAGRVARGVRVAGAGSRVWPNGTLLRLACFHLSRKLGAIDDAMASLTFAINGLPSRFATFPATLLFELGTMMALRCEWSSAGRVFERLWYGNSPQRGKVIGRPVVARWSLDADYFDLRTVAGVFWLGCLRSDGGEGGLDVARGVRGEVLAVGGGKLKKTRNVKLSLTLLDWTLKRSSVHPLLPHALLYLRGDYARLTADRRNHLLLTSTLANVSSLPHFTDQEDEALRTLIRGILLKCLMKFEAGLVGTARSVLGGLVGGGGWVAACAGVEMAEFSGGVRGDLLGLGEDVVTEVPRGPPGWSRSCKPAVPSSNDKDFF
ncbi:hypothetical protein HDU67_003565 [Dinochytrium kinnereticum]|nr:hypothetical protein HDU67_003565 [Dinochytrium kinnereticum]